MSAHTPGPWRYCRENGSPTTGCHMIAGAKPGYLAEVRDCGSGDVGANARLIAAAPELLEALEDLASLAEAAMREVGEYDIEAELADARAAIAKAIEGAA